MRFMATCISLSSFHFNPVATCPDVRKPPDYSNMSKNKKKKMKKKEKRKLELLEQQARQLQEMDAGDEEQTATTTDGAPASKVD